MPKLNKRSGLPENSRELNVILNAINRIDTEVNTVEELNSLEAKMRGYRPLSKREGLVRGQALNKTVKEKYSEIVFNKILSELSK